MTDNRVLALLKEMKDQWKKKVHCNVCGYDFESKQKSVKNISCPHCHSNDSLSIRS